jgi:hypothetical protein
MRLALNLLVHRLLAWANLLQQACSGLAFAITLLSMRVRRVCTHSHFTFTFHHPGCWSAITFVSYQQGVAGFFALLHRCVS